ncbi:uncharacterized protein LOC127278960 [Leptopilina boulardi]|uniref:uncharacterized protein LOC127278960 n=1 Tax=Leptopilina boulardi TaxID=63433 RepID=UPI0021F52885|nr:uncharacterized protein LOC127278960 [Leptopilina boulardi]
MYVKIESNETSNYFQLPYEFFEKFRVPGKVSLLKGWTSYFKEYFKDTYKDCNISFAFNKCRKGVNPDQRIWFAQASCTVNGCAKFNFYIKANDVIEGQEIIVRFDIKGCVIIHENQSVPTKTTNISNSKELPSNDLNFEVPGTFLTDFIKSDNQLRLSKGWIESFKNCFLSRHLCDLVIKDNKILRGHHKIWRAKGNCKVPGCVLYNFAIYNDIKEGSPISVHVKKIGEIIHVEKQVSPIPDEKLEISDNVSSEKSNFELRIPRKFWDDYKKEENQKRLLKGWTDELNGYFKLKNKYCVLSFKYNKCLQGNGKDGKLWYAVAHCTHSGCASFKFSLRSVSNKETEIVIHVERAGYYQHENEIHRRYIRGKNRQQIAQMSSPPSTVKFDMLSKVTEDILLKGNRNDAPSDTILRKISL